MNINADNLKTFFRKATLNGQIPTCIVRFGPKGCGIRSNNSNSNAVVAHMNGVFPSVTIPVKNTATFINAIEQFEGDVDIVMDKNAVFIRNEDREAVIILAEEAYVENELKDDLPFMSKFTTDFPLPAAVLKRVAGNVRMLKVPRIEMGVHENRLSLATGNVGFDRMTEKAVVQYENATSIFGEPLTQIISVVDDSLRVSLRQDFPLRIIETCDKWTVAYYVAPIIEDDVAA